MSFWSSSLIFSWDLCVKSIARQPNKWPYKWRWYDFVDFFFFYKTLPTIWPYFYWFFFSQELADIKAKSFRLFLEDFLTVALVLRLYILFFINKRLLVYWLSITRGSWHFGLDFTAILKKKFANILSLVFTDFHFYFIWYSSKYFCLSNSFCVYTGLSTPLAHLSQSLSLYIFPHRFKLSFSLCQTLSLPNLLYILSPLSIYLPSLYSV